MNATTLVMADTVEDADVVLKALAADDLAARACVDAARLAAEFERLGPPVLVLACKQIETAERHYLALYRHCSRVRTQAHRTVLLCHKDELRGAYELCRKGCFDDYVLYWPMVHDAMRLPMSVRLALRSLHEAPADQRLDEVALQASRVSSLAGTVQAQIAVGEHHGAALARATAAAERELTDAMATLRRRVIDDGLDAAEQVRDPGRMQREFDHLEAERLRPALRQVSAAAQPVQRWIGGLDAELAAPLRSADAAFRQVAAMRHRVLVVDDDRFVQQILERVLRAAGHDVALASSGEEMLVALTRSTPSLVLMDVDLGVDNGIHLTRQLKASDAFKHLPVLMLTGHGDKDTLIGCLAAGAADFAVKPFDREVLLRKVERLLGGQVGPEGGVPAAVQPPRAR